MRFWLRFAIERAWALVPTDWAFYKMDSYEFKLYHALGQADVLKECLIQRKHWDRINSLTSLGTTPQSANDQKPQPTNKD